MHAEDDALRDPQNKTFAAGGGARSGTSARALRPRPSVGPPHVLRLYGLGGWRWLGREIHAHAKLEGHMPRSLPGAARTKRAGLGLRRRRERESRGKASPTVRVWAARAGRRGDHRRSMTVTISLSSSAMTNGFKR